jgi:hypothetical protein
VVLASHWALDPAWPEATKQDNQLEQAMKLNPAHRAIALCIPVLLSACMNDDERGKLGLLQAPRKDAPALSPEDERLRKLMSLTVEIVETPPGGQPKTTVASWDATQATGELRGGCMEACSWTPCIDVLCQMRQDACSVEAERCTMERLFELATTPDSVSYTNGSPVSGAARKLTFQPRTTAESTGLMYEVRKVAQNAAFLGIKMLAGVGRRSNTGDIGQLTDPADPKKDPPGQAQSKLAVTIDKAVSMMVDASYRLAEMNAVTGQWQLGSSSSYTVAQKRAYSGSKLSRAAAAHILVGGGPGLNLDGQDVAALCTTGPLTPGAKVALAAFRESGIEPWLVMDQVDNQTSWIVEGPPGSGSVRERLGVSRNEPRLLEDVNSGGLSVLDLLQLRLQDFEEARAYLVQEYSAFGRNPTATGNLISDGTHTLPRYLATSQEPAPRNDEFYAAMARFGIGSVPTNTPWLDQVPTFPPNMGPLTEETPDALDLADFIYLVSEHANFAVQSTFALPAANELRQLNVMLQDLRTQNPAVVEFSSSGATNIDLLVSSRQPLANVRLVQGEAALDCTTTGAVEGRQCSDLGISPTVVATLSLDSQAGSAGLRYTYWARPFTLDPANCAAIMQGNTYRYYVVADQVADSRLSGDAPYVVLAGIYGFNLAELCAPNRVVRVPFVPEAAAKAASYLRPSSKWCDHALVECDGTTFDERIPLENELADNGDGVENSWQLYLDRAEQAAVKADQFGQTYLGAIQANLQNTVSESQRAEDRERWAEEELDKLQQICGTSLDAPLLMQKLGIPDQNGLDFENQVGTTCNGDADCNGQQCLGGRCVSTPFSFLDDTIDNDGRLRECIGAGSVVDYVVLGSSPVKAQLVGGAVCPSGRMTSSCPSLETNGCTTDANYACVYTTLNVVESTPAAYVSQYQVVTDSELADRCYRKFENERVDNSTFRIDVWGTSFNPNVKLTTGCEAGDNTYVRTASYPVGNDVKFMVLPNTADGHARSGYVTFLGCDSPIADADLQRLGPEGQYWIMSKFLDCMATNLKGMLARRILQKVPQRAVDVLQKYGASSAFPQIGGTYGEAVAKFRGGLLRYSDNIRKIADQTREMGYDLEEVRNAIAQIGVRQQQNQFDLEIIGLQAQQASLLAQKTDIQKVKSVFGAVTSVATSGPAAPVTAVFAVGQVGTDFQLLDIDAKINGLQQDIIAKQGEKAKLEGEYLKLEQAKTLIHARRSFFDRLSQLEGIGKEVRAGLEDMDAALMDMENQREAARRAISRAARILSKTSEASQNMQKFLTFDIELQKRAYDEARQGAVREAFLAKRAIEQRLGMRFADMHENLPLVGAPSTWENDVCVASGINFDALQQGTTTSAMQVKLPFVQQYTDRLRRTVESYRLKYGFQEGVDTVVLSLKEDLFGTRGTCQVPYYNLVTWSSDLTKVDQTDGTGWKVQGCQGCASVAVGSEQPPALSTFAGDELLSNQITFSANGSVVQPIVLDQDTYILSSYIPSLASGTNTGAAAELRDKNGTAIPVTQYYHEWSPDGTWERLWNVYQIPIAGQYFVAIAGGAGSTLEVAGLMLERRHGAEDPATAPTASAYQVRGGASTYEARTCADVTGSVFRATRFKYNCEKLCPDGFSGNCDVSLGAQRCFWETPFPLGEEIFEVGSLAGRSGFAIGNFNYRIEEVAVNFVGTSLRSCNAGSGPACYANGSIPYTLKDLPAYTVRNHLGEDFRSSLFDGVIEHARGLATERYLTNPLSSADAGLLQPFIRREFRGRPLTGNYVLRIWNEASVAFDKIEDVQLYIKYRYWTRLN